MYTPPPRFLIAPILLEAQTPAKADKRRLVTPAGSGPCGWHGPSFVFYSPRTKVMAYLGLKARAAASRV
jgi:hypothetical protein